MAKVAHMLN